MKTEEQIKAKIAEHEKHINAILETDREEWRDIDVSVLKIIFSVEKPCYGC